MCQHLLQGDCKFGSKCKRSHDLAEEETKRKLLKWGLVAALLPAVLEIYLNASAIKNGSTAAPAPEPKSPVTKGKRATVRMRSALTYADIAASEFVQARPY